MSKKTTKCRFDVASRNANGLISNSKAPRSEQKRVGNIKVAGMIKKTPTVKIKANSEICGKKLILEIPLRTVSEANRFEPWQAKHKRHKSQQHIVALMLKPIRENIQLPCKILFTRIAPKKLDKHDNLPMSFKYIVDACCAIITGNFISGKADSDERISIAYDQIESREYGIKIEVSW